MLFDETETEELNILVRLSIITLSVPSNTDGKTQIMSIVLILNWFSSSFIFSQKDAASDIIIVTVLLRNFY